MLSICVIMLTSCNWVFHKSELPSVPLFYYDFNANCDNSGIDNFFLLGSKNTSYCKGIKDSCFNLSISAENRNPITIKHSNELMLNHYKGFSFIVWVKQNSRSNGVYGIIGNKSLHKNTDKGWLISTTQEGSWQFEISDGNHYNNYTGTPIRQKLNDNEWHQIAFTFNKKQKELRLYFDGCNVSILNTQVLKHFDSEHDLMIGCSPAESNYAQNCFYGMLDEIGLWSRTLTPSDIKEAYQTVSNLTIPAQPQKVSTPFKILNWNIWNGGTQLGIEAGPDQIINMIKKSNADIINLQDHQKTGAYIADCLNYYYYEISNELCIISRFPIERTHPIYKPERIGVAEFKLRSGLPLYICSVLLSDQPNIRGMLMSQNTDVDSINAIERESRAYEMKFILNELSRIEERNGSYILSGDLNSGSHLDWTPENKKNKYGKAISFPTTLLLEKKHYTDAFRVMFPDENAYPGFTYSPIFTEGYKDRLNYTFYKSNHIYPSKFQIINSNDTFFPSDHAALLTTFSSKH